MVAGDGKVRTVRRRRDPLAESRVNFLTAEPVDPDRVRGTILESWRRSRDLKVAADRVKQPYSAAVDTGSPLAVSAEPILRNLRGQLDGQPMSIILTDPTGIVLSRLSGTPELDRYLDGVQLAPGFSYSEEFVGTNGIGTALEVGGPTFVFGHEHYAENLDRLACAGVPIRHPISGRTVGAIDLTCWAKDAGPLLLTLAKSTAEQIRQALLADAGSHQLELLQAYLRTCRRTPGIVFAVSGETTILNDLARSMLDPADQAALLAHAADSLLGGDRRSVCIELPSGTTAKLYGRPVGGGARAGATVVHVTLQSPADDHVPSNHGPSRMSLPGLVGSAPVWLRACDEIEAASRAGEWVAVAGEPGVGKLALLHAVQLRHQPVRRVVVVDARDAPSDPLWTTTVRLALRDGAGCVIIRHLDALDGARLRDIEAALDEARQAERETPLWVAVTMYRAGTNPNVDRVLRLFPRTVEVPPVRLHLEDVHQLVPFFLGRLGQGEALTCSPEAMTTLARGVWPGNTAQLLQALRQVAKLRRTGTITLEDLPAEVRTVSRRRLSLLESLERDAVVQGLADSGGDKALAAKSLGISRATIYRKIHDYGIVNN